jgi:hypothetical protein
MDPARLLLLLSVFAASEAANAPQPPPSELPSVFFISKSENKNQVHYAVAVDANCTPAGGAPVRPYWRMLEQGAAVTAPLLAREQRAYGVASQSVTRRWATGGRIALVLQALPQRPLTIVTGKDSKGVCVASAYTVIQHAPARLHGIHVVLKWLGLGVDSLIVKGWARSDQRVLRETIQP